MKSRDHSKQRLDHVPSRAYDDVASTVSSTQLSCPECVLCGSVLCDHNNINIIINNSNSEVGIIINGLYIGGP